MATEYRYILQTGSKKYICPSCGKKCFVPYLDTETGQPLPEQYGRCDRETNCAYWFNPYKDGYANIISQQEKGENTRNWKPKKPAHQPKPREAPVPSFIPVEIFKNSRANYEQNNFVQWLTCLFGIEITSELISKYHIGTSKYWNGSVVFWQIDGKGKIRTGKVMLYNSVTGNRVKEPCNHITWAHTALKLHEFELQQCYFGTHLLKDKTKLVALVESEKTAIIASVYFPSFIWLAVGGLSNLNADKCQVLEGRKVCLFPDLNGFEKWNGKAKELAEKMPGTQFIVSDILERNATETECKAGFDLADYLIRFDFQRFQWETPQEESVVSTGAKTEDFQGIVHVLAEPSLAFALTELESFFIESRIPDIQVRFNQCSTISNVSLFVKSHLAVIRANNGSRFSKPYLERLQHLKQVLN